MQIIKNIITSLFLLVSLSIIGLGIYLETSIDQMMSKDNQNRLFSEIETTPALPDSFYASIEKYYPEKFQYGIWEVLFRQLVFGQNKANQCQSQAIQIATNSKYSHMGIIYQEGDDFFVYEAVQPVKITKLTDWINRGENGNYVVKRLKNSEAILTKTGIAKMKSIGQQYLGKDYDLRFEWSDNKIYCSELVWKIYKEAFNIEIGALERIGDFNLSNKTVQKKVRERYGDKVPKEEWVITPDQMFHAKNLRTVREK